MNKPLDTDSLAKQDIIARPEVTGGDKAGEAKPEKTLSDSAKSGKLAVKSEVMEPDTLEIAASKILSKTAEDFREQIGAGRDADFTTLLQEVLSGGFVALRFMTGRPWVRFAVAGGALAVSMVPPALRYMKARKEQEEKDND